MLLITIIEAWRSEPKGDLDGALADFNKAIELKPDYVNAYDARGNVRSKKGDLDGALADYNKAIGLNPTNFNAYDNRGNVKQKKVIWTALWRITTKPLS